MATQIEEEDERYTFTLTEQDQKRFIEMPHDMKYNDMIEILKLARGPSQPTNTTTPSKHVNTQSNSRIVLSYLDQKMVQSTILLFPLDLPLFSREVYLFEQFGSTPVQIYDVRFVMLLIYHSLSPTLLVDCSNFVMKRALSLTLAGLTSSCGNMRKLCYKILERFYGHLESSIGFDKKLYTNFCDLLRNSLVEVNQQLKPCFALFLSRMIDVFAHPDDPLYETIKEFISGRPRLDINTIELFDDLVCLSDVDKYQYAMRWLLAIFRDGMRTQADLKLAKNVHLIPYIMNLYNSQLRFERANEVICSILIRFTRIDRGVNLIVVGYAFLAWLDQVIRSHVDDDTESSKGAKSESLNDITVSLSSLCFNLIDNINARDENLYSSAYLELVGVYLSLYDLLIKAGRVDIMEHHIEYSGKILRMLHRNTEITAPTKNQIYKALESKLSYLETQEE